MESRKQYWLLLEERMRFLRAAGRRPEIRLGKALYEDVYLKLPSLPDSSPRNWTATDWADSEKREAELRRLVDSWAKRFNLPGVITLPGGGWTLGWAALLASDEMAVWAQLPAVRRLQKVKHRSFNAVLYVHPEKWPHWMYGEENETEYRKRLDVWFEQAREKYIDTHKSKRAKLPRMRKSTVLVEQRYEMAALRICAGWKFSDIAQVFQGEDGLNVQVVQNHVNVICSRIGLFTS